MVRRRTLLLTSRPVKVAVIATGRIQKTHARPLQIHQNEFPLKTSRLLPRIKIEKNGHERQPRNRSHPIQQKQQKQHLHLVRKLQHRILWLAQTVKIGRASQQIVRFLDSSKVKDGLSGCFLAEGKRNDHASCIDYYLIRYESRAFLPILII